MQVQDDAVVHGQAHQDADQVVPAEVGLLLLVLLLLLLLPLLLLLARVRDEGEPVAARVGVVDEQAVLRLEDVLMGGGRGGGGG